MLPDQLLKDAFLGEAKTTIRLSIKSWFADLELSTSDSIWGLLFYFDISISRIGPFDMTLIKLDESQCYSCSVI